MNRSAIASGVLAVLIAAPAWAQQSKPSSGTPSSPSRPTTSNRQQVPTPSGQTPKILYLSGQVVFEDGTPPAQPVYVDLVCNGQILRQVQTRTKGSFNFRLGERNSFDSMSASVGGRLPDVASPRTTIGGGSHESDLPGGIRSAGNGRYDMNACHIRLNPTPGVTANRVDLGFRSVFDNPDVGLIVMKRRNSAAGSLLSVNSLNAPKKARKNFKKAQKLIRKKNPKFEKASEKLLKAVEIYPAYAAAWQLLGEVRASSEDEEGARQAFAAAIEADPHFLSPLLSLASMDARKGNWQAAVTWTAKILKLDPALPQALYVDGVSQYYMGNHQQAYQSLVKLREGGHFERFPASHFLMGDLSAMRGDISLAAREFRTYLAKGNPPDNIRRQVEEKLLEWEESGLIKQVSDGGMR